MTTTALTAPLSPAAYATERTPLHDETWLRVTLDRIFADLRDTWEPVRVYTVDACPRCHADSDQPCVTRSGRVTRRHVGRQG